MNRTALYTGVLLLWAVSFHAPALCLPTAKGAARTTVPTRVISTQPPLRWEDAMISGNGSTGIMAMGLPLDDLIIVNHEKLWTVGNDYRPQTPDLREAWKEAKQIARTGRYLDADMHIVNAARKSNQALYSEEFGGSRPRYDRCHPGFHLHVTTQSNGTPLDYRRETDLAAFYELMHAVGRYALICGGTGDLAPSLMGLWGNEWTPPWDGRYTFDANLNLAMSAVSQGNLPEVMHTYTSFLERYTEDWRRNAQQLYGCDGVVTDLCQGWRHGAVLMSTYPWTGGAGWLSNYLYDHYLFTQDRDYLRQHVVPLLEEVAAFYEDFLQTYPSHNGRAVFYPSISPENTPVMTPADQSTNVVPNATGEISICREAVTHLIEACNELNIEQDNIPRWRALLSRLPDYVINSDGALAEWAYPGLGDRYNHRHSSHLYAIYPSLEVSPKRTPDLFKAARTAMEKRLEAGLGGDSAHGLMHISLIAARLKNADLLWRMLTDFASLPFLNTSFITCHNPGPRIYNLDATFSMPAVMMEMLLYSEPGLVELLPALPIKHFSRGTLCGALARGGIVVEQLHWNKTLNRVDGTLRSAQAQTIELRFGIDLRFVNAADPQDRSRVSSGTQRGTWHIDLPANRALRLECRM